MTLRSSIGIAALAAALAAGFLAGRASAPARAEGGDGPVVATFRGDSLRASAVRAALAARQAAVRGGGPQAARGVVEELARSRALAARALERGYDRDPEVAARHAEQLAAAYVEKEVGAVAPPTDAEVKAWFEAHRAELAEPERVRVALVSFPVASADERAPKRARAAAALREALARKDDHYAFGRLARARSEDPRTAARDGELGELAREGLEAAAGPEVAAAAFAMPAPGVRDALVEAASGWHVLKLLGREPAWDPSFDEVRERLRERLAAERRAQRRKELVDAAWKPDELRIDEEALRKLVSELETARR